MTGPEHYREAERLMAPKPGTEARTFLPTPFEISLAQVHATLALAAATALRDGDDSTMLQKDWDAWVAAASEYPARQS